MRNRLLKVYTVLIVLGLILFAFVLSKKAFMGKHMKMLHNFEQDVATAPATPTPSPAPADTMAPDVASGVVPDPAPSPTSTPTLGEPEKGGVGEALKKIRGSREKQNEGLENSFNTPE